MSRLRSALVIALAVTFLVGCTPARPIDEGVGLTLQKSVTTIAATAAAGDPSTALTQLDALEQAVLTATAEGDISGARAGEISSALQLVRSDLESMLAGLQPTSPTKTPKDEKGNNGKGNGNGKKDD